MLRGRYKGLQVATAELILSAEVRNAWRGCALTSEDGIRQGGTAELPMALTAILGKGMLASMTSATKSSITLPPSEHEAILRLRRRLQAPSNVDVVRQALKLLEETLAQQELRDAYAQASLRARPHMQAELAELDGVTGDGLSPW